MWTRNQERLLVKARLRTFEHIFFSESWWAVNEWEESKWIEFAKETGLGKLKTPLECYHHFCDLYHHFKYLKSASKRGERENYIPDPYYVEFNWYYHILM